MSQQVDKLVKAGLEGFALLDACRRKKPAYDPYQHQYNSSDNQKQYVYRGPDVITAKEKVIHRNNQQHYVYRGPQVIMTVREPVIDSDTAAQLYGGISVVDHRMT